MPNYKLRLKPITDEINADSIEGALTIFADVLMDKAYWLKQVDFVYIREVKINDNKTDCKNL